MTVLMDEDTGRRSKPKILAYERDRSLPAFLNEQIERLGDKAAIICGDLNISFSDLDRISDRLAADLMDAGVSKGDIVGLLVPRSLEVIVAKLAIMKAGGAYAPIDPAFPPDQIEHIISECQPKYVFARKQFESLLQTCDMSGCVVRDLDEAFATSLKASPLRPAFPAIGGGDVAYIMYTSGSTGKPKGVVVTHRGIARAVLGQNYISYRPDDIVLHSTTISFDVATTEIWGALLNGCTLSVLPDANFSVSRLCDVIERDRVSIASLTTGLFNLFADYAREQLPTLRHLIFAGEVGSAEHARRFMKAFPNCQITNAYGPTEATVYATAYAIPRDFDGMELPIGKAISHTGIVIVDDELNALEPGVDGQLAITGDGVALGYLKRPELTAEKFVDLSYGGETVRAYLSGDIAQINADGNLQFKGRNDRQVKINGKRIELDAIERALQRNDKLSDGVVVCHQDGATKRIIAYLRPLEKSAQDDPDFARGVLDDLRAVLPPFMIPSQAVVMADFPMNRAGKIQRSKLAPPKAAVTPQSTGPTSDLQRILHDLWADVLGIDTVPMDANCFDLGATSLHVMRVHAGLEKELGRKIEVVSFFQNPTISALATDLDSPDAIAGRVSKARERAMRRQHRMVAAS